jgi:hypothetical protein
VPQWAHRLHRGGARGAEQQHKEGERCCSHLADDRPDALGPKPAPRKEPVAERTHAWQSSGESDAQGRARVRDAACHAGRDHLSQRELLHELDARRPASV